MVVWIVVGYVCPRCLLDLGFIYLRWIGLVLEISCGSVLVWFTNGCLRACWVAGGVFVFTFCLALLCCIEMLVLLGWIVAFGVNWLWRLCVYAVVGVVGWFVWLRYSAVVLCLVVAEYRSGFA